MCREGLLLDVGSDLSEPLGFEVWSHPPLCIELDDCTPQSGLIHRIHVKSASKLLLFGRGEAGSRRCTHEFGIQYREEARGDADLETLVMSVNLVEGPAQ